MYIYIQGRCSEGCVITTRQRIGTALKTKAKAAQRFFFSSFLLFFFTFRSRIGSCCILTYLNC
jgi:hypothetical protein